MSNKSLDETTPAGTVYGDAGMELVSTRDPSFFASAKGFFSDAALNRQDGSVLDRKTKDMIIMICNSVLRCEMGVRRHTRQALQAGATPREILQFLEVAAVASGMPTLWVGARILAEEIEALGIPFE